MPIKNKSISGINKFIIIGHNFVLESLHLLRNSTFVFLFSIDSFILDSYEICKTSSTEKSKPELPG